MAKILIVDDDPDFVAATRVVLEKEGHQVIHAPNGDIGYTRTKKEQPDLMILDVIMDSVLDGVATSERIHDDPELRDTPGHHGHIHRQYRLRRAVPDRRLHPHQCVLE